MLRLTLILLVVIYAVLVLYSGEPETSATVRATATIAPEVTPVGDDALHQSDDGRLVLRAANGEELVINAVINPGAVVSQEDGIVSVVTRADLGPTTDTPIQADPDDFAAEPASETATDADTQAGTDTAATDTADTDDTTQDVLVVEQAPPTPNAELLQVSGDRVNFRAGPSTDNEILASLTRGTQLELIERVADGWAHLRVLDTGLEGYMSGDFLEPVN